MRLRRHVHMRRLSGSAVVTLVVVITALSGGVGVLIATVTAAAPPPPVGAVAVGRPLAGGAPMSGAISTSIGSVPVPSGFSVSNQADRSVGLIADGGRERVVVSEIEEPDGIDSGVLTQNLITGDRSTLDANTQICADDGTDTATLTVSASTVSGIYLPLCVSVVPQNAPAFTARDYYYAGLGQRDGHPVALVVEVFASTDRFPALVARLRGFVPSVRWSASAPS